MQSLLQKLNECIESNSLTYSWIESFKRDKTKLFRYTGIAKYIKLIKELTDKLNDQLTLLENEPTLIKRLIKHSLSTIDSKLLFHDGYTSLSISKLEKDFLFSELQIYFSYRKLVPFSIDRFCSYFNSYLLAIFTIEELFELIAPRNIGFLKTDKNVDNYLYYKLSKTGWTIDRRFEEFTIDFVCAVRPMIIQLYRRIYYDIFKDNVYREGYKAQAMDEFKCLEYNLSLLSDFYKCNAFIRTFVEIHSILLQGVVVLDDIQQKDNFKRHIPMLELSDAKLFD